MHSDLHISFFSPSICQTGS